MDEWATFAVESLVQNNISHCLRYCPGSCVDDGFSGCCNPNEHPTCKAQALEDETSCYCDQVCYNYGDCCPDIADIGCYACGFAHQDKNTSMCFHFDITHLLVQQLQAFHSLHRHQVKKHAFASIWWMLAFRTSTLKTGSCAEAGFKTCCNSTSADNCFGYPPTCYCDEVCYIFGDCCGDVVQAGCLGRLEFVYMYLTTKSFFTHSP